MANRFKNYLNLLRKSKKEMPAFYYFNVFIIVFALVTPLFFLYFNINPAIFPRPISTGETVINPQERIVYHGPNPDIVLIPEPQKKVLSHKDRVRTSSKRISKITSPADPVSGPTVDVPLTPAPSVISPVNTPIEPNQTAAQTANTKVFGIAAGGGLSFMDQPALNSYFSSLKSLGVGWVRFDIEWGVVQPSGASSYQWDSTDRVVATAKQYGINSLATIAYAPKWAREASCASIWACPPASPSVYAKFASDVVSRYKGTVKYWEIWNEPNISIFWAQKPDESKYAEILKAAYAEIKKADPSSIVLCAGLAASEDSSSGSIAPLTFMRVLYERGYNNYFDAVSLHPYSFPALSSYQAAWNSWQQMATVRQLMVANLDGSKKIWVTEMGSPTGGPGNEFGINQLANYRYGTDFMTESAQAQILADAVGLYVQDSDWLGGFFWYSLKDNGTRTDTPENFFGLLRFDGSPKPAFSEYQNLIRK